MSGCFLFFCATSNLTRRMLELIGMSYLTLVRMGHAKILENCKPRLGTIELVYIGGQTMQMYGHFERFVLKYRVCEPCPHPETLESRGQDRELFGE